MEFGNNLFAVIERASADGQHSGPRAVLRIHPHQTFGTGKNRPDGTAWLHPFARHQFGRHRQHRFKNRHLQRKRTTRLRLAIGAMAGVDDRQLRHVDRVPNLPAPASAVHAFTPS